MWNINKYIYIYRERERERVLHYEQCIFWVDPWRWYMNWVSSPNIPIFYLILQSKMTLSSLSSHSTYLACPSCKTSTKSYIYKSKKHKIKLIPYIKDRTVNSFSFQYCSLCTTWERGKGKQYIKIVPFPF